MQRCFRVYFIQNSAAVGTCTCAICGFVCSCCCQPRRSKRFFRIRVSSLLEMVTRNQPRTEAISVMGREHRT